ncbi:MAG: DUF86 domain-containing protein [Nitrospirae bacterium]|nr:DUF86 domain-containing protein [Nitrospirota bacterium]
MIDKYLVEKKLRRIEDFLRELKEVKIEDFEGFKGNTIVKRFVERNIELAIEQMVDICKHFITGLDLREPETYAECFSILSENMVVPKEAGETFKSMVRFRNILIHGYDNVDDSVTYGIYKKHLQDFRNFINVIREFLAAGKNNKDAHSPETSGQ